MTMIWPLEVLEDAENSIISQNIIYFGGKKDDFHNLLVSALEST